MNLFVSLTNENFRRIFLTFYLLSCLLPVLIMLFVVYQHAVPTLSADQLDALSTMFNIGAVSILTIQALGFALLWWWTQSLERFTTHVAHISNQHLSHGQESAEANGNELLRLNTLFESLHKELQTRVAQAGESARRMQTLTRKMAALACTDDLTQLFNRRHFRQKFTEAVRRADRLGCSAWLIRFEIDDFSHLGDKDADMVLKEVGEITRRTLPAEALPFRIGRNEFAIIVTEVDGKVAARITHSLAMAVSAYPVKGKNGHALGKVSISCGISGYRSDQNAMFTDAGRALVNAQRRGQPIGVAPAA